MTINWYPGHMHKARREIKQVLPEIDLVIELLDARLPFSSSNPVIANLARYKPNLKLLSKTDLADPAVTASWLDYFNQQDNTQALAIVTTASKTLAPLLTTSVQMAGQVRSSRSVRALVVGIPNVGKSTLINSLTGRKIARVGNEPAVTKRQQKIQVDERLQLIDTPGILWPKIAHPASGYRLAASGAVRNTAMDYEDVGLWAAEFLLSTYPEAAVTRYKLATVPASGQELLLEVAKRRGGLRSGGVADLHRAGEVLLTDLRAGHLGRLSLERPEQIKVELAELAKSKVATDQPAAQD